MPFKEQTCAICGQKILEGQSYVNLPSGKIVHASCAGQ